MKTTGLALLFSVAALACVPSGLRAQKVGAEGGNVVFTDAAGRAVNLTDTGRDSAPDLSPDGRRVVFVRATPGRTVETAAGEEEVTELWMVRTDGGKPTRLVQGKADPEPQRMLAGLQSPQFAPDGTRVFFLSVAWATSGAVHVVELTTGKQRFVCPGNALEVVRAGKYRGHLLVQQHRYFLGGGSYDWFWLLGEDGKKEVGPVGENTENFRDAFGE